MAVGYGSLGSAGVTGSYCQITATPPNGSYVVVTGMSSAGSTSFTISDTLSGTWATVVPYNSTNFASQSWFRTTPCDGSSMTIQVGPSSPGSSSLAIFSYFTGANGSTSSYVQGTQTSTNSFPTITSPATSASGDLVLGIAMQRSGSATIGAGSGYTLGQTGYVSTSILGHEYQIATGSGQTFSTTFSVASGSVTNTKTAAIVINVASAPTTTYFRGWGIPLI